MNHANDKVKQRLLQQSRGRNGNINDQIEPILKLLQAFIPNLLIPKLQENPNKTEQVILMASNL